MTAGTPLVFLPGALDELEGSDVATRSLRASRPLIPIAYRADDRLESLLGRIAEAADAADALRFDLLGQSYGGWIAQCAVRRFPDRARRLVLSHSFALRPQDAWRFRLGMKLLRAMPLKLLRPLLLKRVRKALAPLASSDPDRVERQLAALARSLDEPTLRAKLVAQQRCMQDSLGPHFAACPEVHPDLPVLILESDDDPLLDAKARQMLRERHPGAEVHCFPGTGHISAMVASEAYAARVARFLDD